MRRSSAPREIPPPLELECLKALYKLGEGSVKDVRGELAARRNLAYTTVMTLLDRLARKGAVSRRKTGRLFLYSPALPQEALRKLAVREFVDSFFGGSREALLDFLRAEPAPRTTREQELLDTALL